MAAPLGRVDIAWSLARYSDRSHRPVGAIGLMRRYAAPLTSTAPPHSRARTIGAVARSGLPGVILGLQRSAGNRATRAAVPRLQGRVQTLQRRVRLPAGGGKPDRVASTQGRMVVANRDTLYADARLIQQSQEALAARKSFVKLTTGP